MFLTDHLKKKICKPLSKEHSCKITMLSNAILFGRRFLKIFLLWLPWQPEFFMQHNYLKEFEGGSHKEHSCEIW